MFERLSFKGRIAAVALIFLTALLVRVAYVHTAPGLAGIQDSDAYDYLSYAQNLAAGKGFAAGVSHAGRAPGYPVFLAAVFGVFGPSIPAVKLVQCLLGALTCVLVYFLAARVSPRGGAVLAAAAACVYFGLFEQPAHVLSETLFTFLFSGAILLFLGSGASPWYSAAGGATLALATLTRPISLIFPLFMVPWFFLSRDRLSASKNAALALAVFAAVIAPWTIRNYRIYHAPVIINIQAGQDFWATNNPFARGKWAPERVDLEKYQNLPEPERDRRYFGEGLAFLHRQNAGQLLTLGTLKLAVFLYPFLPGYDITFVLVLPFALAGAVRILRRREPLSLIFIAVAAFFLCVTLLFYGNPRFRGPFSPFLVILGAEGAVALYRRYRSRLFLAAAPWFLLNFLVMAYAEPIRLVLRQIGR